MEWWLSQMERHARPDAQHTGKTHGRTKGIEPDAGMGYKDAANGMHQLAVGTMKRLAHLWHHPQSDEQAYEHQHCHNKEYGSPSEPITDIPADGTCRDDACYESRRYIAHIP